MKKKTNKILLIAALVVVVLNLAIIGTGLALATRNAETADTDCTTVITLGDDDEGITVITEDEDSDDPTVITINYDEDSYGVTVDSEDGTTVVSGKTGE